MKKELSQRHLNQILLDNMPCVALLLRPSTREVIASNQAAIKVGAVPGTKCYSTWGKRDKPCPWCLAPALWKTGRAQHVEVEGMGGFWDAYWVPVGPNLYLHYAFDISDRKQAEAALKEKEESERKRAVELQAVLDAVPAYIFFAHDPDCRYMTGNHATYELLRLPLGSNVSKSAAEGERPETFSAIKGGKEIIPQQLPVQRAAATGEVVRDYEFDVVYADGTPRRLLGNAVPLLAKDGQPRGAVAAFVDVTDRKRAEEALRQERDFIDALLQTLGALVLVLDSAGRVVRFNRACEQASGYTFEEVKGKLIFDLFLLPEEADEATEVFQKMTTGDFPCSHENHWVARDGKWRLFSWSNTALTDEQGQVLYVIGTGIDITERRQAEGALRVSEERFQLAMRGANDGLWDWNMITDEVYYSPRWKSMLGYAEDELANHLDTWQRLVHPEDHDASMALVKDLMEAGRENFEIESRIQHKDGHYLDILSRAFLVRDSRGEARRLVGTHVDITERKRAEDAVRKQKEILQKIFDHLPVMIGFIDQDGRIELINRAFERTLGWSLEELQQQDLDIFAEWYPDPEYRQKVLDFMAAAEGKWADFKTRLRDGRVIDTTWADVHLSDGTVIGIGQDITTRKRAEKALRDNEQFLMDVFNSIHDGMIILTPDFTITRINPAMKKLPFVQPMAGRKCYEVFHDRGEPCEVCLARQVFQTGQPAEKALTVKADDGSIISIEVHAFPLLNSATGQVDQVIEFLRDITARQRADDERFRFSKLESLSLLAGGIAHDFNNILTIILGNIGLGMLNRKLDEEVMKSLLQAEQACFRAQGLSMQLLTFAKGGAPIKKVISLSKLVRESGKLALAGSKSRCEFSVPEDLWSVEADEEQINQVINNLLINADQAMPSGGIIKIEAGNIVVEEGSDLPLSGGKYVKLTITDQGIGITGKYLDQIFDPYFTTKQKGSGLGLATAYSIIIKHSGYIKVESQVGAGTTFHIYLPAKEGKPIVAIGKQVTAIIGNGKVLVMDDDEMIREFLCLMLRKLGYESDSASDGSQAIEKFVKAKESGRPFDAVILDLTVSGGMGGKETLENLLRVDPQIKAIVSSGYSDDPIMANFKEYGFKEVIAKPYRVVDLSKILQRVISKQGN